MMAARRAETAFGSGMYRHYPRPTVTTAWTAATVRVVRHHGEALVMQAVLRRGTASEL